MPLPVTILVAFLGSAVLTVFTIHIGSNIGVRLLGEGKCLSTSSINAINWLPLSVVVSTVLVGVMARHEGSTALVYILAGPLMAIIVAPLTLRFGEIRARKKEFGIRDGKLINLKKETELHPLYVETKASYYSTGPASGYGLYALALHDGEGGQWTNGYVSKSENDRVFAALTRDCGCAGLCLAVLSRESPLVFRSVTLGSEWTSTLCAGLSELAPQDRAWWAQWLQPTFGVMGAREVPKEEVRAALDQLEAAYGERMRQVDRIQQDSKAIRNLLETAQEPIRMMTPEALSEAVETARSDGSWVMMEWKEPGICAQTIESPQKG